MELRREALERLQVLREARASVAEPGVQERPADPRIGAHHVGDGDDVRSRPLADPRERVRVGDLHSQERVARVLGEFRRVDVGLDQRGPARDASARTALASRANAQGCSAPTRIRSGCRLSSTALPSRRNSGFETTSSSRSDSVPFAQEDSAHALQPFPQERSTSRRRRSDQSVPSHLPGGVLDGHEVRLARGPRRGADADEDDIGVTDQGVGGVVHEPSRPSATLRSTSSEAGSWNGMMPAWSARSSPASVSVPDDLVTESGECRTRHQADMAGTDDDDVHRLILSALGVIRSSAVRSGSLSGASGGAHAERAQTQPPQEPDVQHRIPPPEPRGSWASR